MLTVTYYVLSQDCWIWVTSDLSLTFFFAIENRISRFNSGSFPRAVKTTQSRDYDVVNLKSKHCGPEEKESEERWKLLLAGAPNDVSCKCNTYTTGVSMHYFPKNEAVRQRWINFVQRHRNDFKPSHSSVLCSVHFKDSCFEHRSIAVPRENGEFTVIHSLLRHHGRKLVPSLRSLSGPLLMQT